ncbi:MAG: hypothetical protein DRP29_09010 [Thermodesulfobacteriota bacterium]|nr:MAG: hypothetical protein DRP29_09010 [Thermodesulfobacteriota bacterium]
MKSFKFPFEVVPYKKGQLVKFDRENVEKYLDWAIDHWRNKLKLANSDEDKLIARCYIDAYLSVKYSLFGRR